MNSTRRILLLGLSLTSTLAAFAACSGETVSTNETAKDAGADTAPGTPDAHVATDGTFSTPDAPAIGPDAPAADDAPVIVDAAPPSDAPGQPPAPAPDSGPTSSAEEHNFAVQTLFMGDMTRAGTPSADAWESFGFDLDGKVSTASSTDVCTLAAGAPKSAQADGLGGIDNSWGENIVPIFETVGGSDFSTKINAAIDAGDFTLLFDVTGLADGDPSQNATGLSGFFLVGGLFSSSGSSTPTFTKADSWPVNPNSLTNPADPRSSRYPFSAPYVTGGTFVSGGPTTVVLQISIGGSPLALTIHQAHVTFDHSTPGKAANGMIGGVLDTTEFLAALQQAAGAISTSLCSGSAFASIAEQISQAQDIMADGTNQAGVACNAISIGLGFTGAEIGLPTIVAPAVAPPPNPCAD